MKKKIIAAILGAILCFLLVPIAYNSIRYKMSPIAAALIPVMDGTEWSPNYSYWKFKKIRVGMTTNDVLNILGPCLAVTQYQDRTQWHYTRGKDGGVMSGSAYSTHFRIIHFNTNGVVTSKTYAFYFD